MISCLLLLHLLLLLQNLLLACMRPQPVRLQQVSPG